MARMTSAKSEKREQLFGNNYQLITMGEKERFAPYISERTNTLIERESQNLGVSKTDYMLYRLLSADIDELMDLKYMSPQIVESCCIRTNAERKHGENGRFVKREGEVVYADAEKARRIRMNMRISSVCKSEIERRAEELSVAVSEYIALVFLHYDFNDGVA